MPPLPRPPRPPAAAHWRLDPRTIYLNHGSFGACPAAVLERQADYRELMERDGVRFFCEHMNPLLDASRAALAEFLGAAPADLAFVPNATAGVATAIENIARGVGMPGGRPLGPGDELLVSPHEYPACRNQFRAVARRTGCEVVEADIPLGPAPGEPPVTADWIAAAVLGAVTERTRVALLSAITSPTAIVMPLDRILPALRERGVLTIVDGAHAPGAIPVDLGAMRPDIFTANCHKWLCGPKSAAVLAVREDLRPHVRPLVLSNGAEAPPGGRPKFWSEFDYVGTSDLTPAMAAGDAVRLLPEIAAAPWEAIRSHNRDLARRARDILSAALAVPPPYTDALLGPMAMLPLPEIPAADRARLAARPTRYADALQDALLDRHGIQVPVWRAVGAAPGASFDGRRFVRISAQLYNTEAEYHALAAALLEELERERIRERAGPPGVARPIPS